MLLNPRTTAALVFLAVMACLSLAVAADDSDVFRSKAKYMKYVGTYYDEVGDLINIHADGTVTVVYGNMFSEPGVGGRRVTPALGVWRKVGEHQLQVTSLRFMTDAEGNNYRPGGLIQKTTVLAVFDEPVRGQSLGYTIEMGGVMVEFFRPDQNPTTDEPIGVIASTGDGSRGYRLEGLQTGS